MKPGDLVADSFTLVRELGRGGMGVVWEVEHVHLRRRFAMKILRERLQGDARAAARFEREARVASAIDHPGAVDIVSFGYEGGRAYLVMELVDGPPLRARLGGASAATGGGSDQAGSDDTPLSLEAALDVARQLAEVLAAAHRLGVVHRDLKPENVLLDRDLRPRLVDFGLAFLSGREGDSRLTAEGVVAGTPAYTSPEQARGAEVGPPTDVYALGCLLFEMVAGRPPFVGADAEVLTRHMYAPPPPLRSDASVPAALRPLVERMLDKRPAQRPTAAEVAAALAELTPEGRRGRTRDDRHLEGRSARMVDAPRGRAPSMDEIELAVLGPLPAEVALALATGGIHAYVGRVGDPAGAMLVCASEGAEVRARALASAGTTPVLCEVPADDLETMRALVRGGVAEVVPSPLRAEDLARRVRRAVRRARGRARGRER